jgi:hypothetical protein
MCMYNFFVFCLDQDKWSAPAYLDLLPQARSTDTASRAIASPAPGSGQWQRKGGRIRNAVEPAVSLLEDSLAAMFAHLELLPCGLINDEY